MNKPDYVAPQTLEEAFKALKDKNQAPKIIAGGTDLVPRMRAEVVSPGLLVDLRLLGLDEIKDQGDWIGIGAAATHAQILDSKILAEHFPALIEAASDIAGPPIRNRGTLGGNLVNASPAADLATPLLVYDARAVITGQDGETEVQLGEFFTGPGKTVLKPVEILTEIRIPKMPPQTAAAFIKLGKRKAMAIAVVSAAVRFTLNEGGAIAEARIALGSVAPVPLRAIKAETALQGQVPSEELFAAVGEAASEESTPISDLRSTGEYRKKMVAVLTRRALTAAWQRLKAD
ncbi:MAG: xanthine dehydrogenase family protein subunit M [Chloroflexi bacterium]|nr:xanthine dehydrogenase family protein subunit M [Chloroflexota bacterium]